MQISPMLQYRLAFWSITGTMLLPMIVIIILAVINPFWFRSNMINWTERFARKLAEWRDETKLVKYYYDKAHLFDKLKA
jgi:hypothetical protein